MIFLRSFDGRAASLRAQILVVEHRIRRRRGHIDGAVGGITDNLRRQIISPAAVITAGVLGVALHRREWLSGSRVLAISQAVNAGLKLLMTTTTKQEKS
ncbi:hypothetical protein E4656_11930 [Natronospirillum operosum]|uniref:Uncharacterized protein n=1 Tax=Natronospirillum operosum TaxID=2759953 RepID=A0A4Z0WDL0_9GAMM|nr:hypothetical protein [Natronospirillum operosum]TGG92829.1 hypothetical protein E4656_11930 [Natronospirillum operosum]